MLKLKCRLVLLRLFRTASAEKLKYQMRRFQQETESFAQARGCVCLTQLRVEEPEP